MKIAVIGAGAAGLLAAGTASKFGADVTIFERNEKIGKKIYITGKGRCNVTNCCDEKELISNVVTNPRFLFSAFHAWNSYDTMALMEEFGTPVKVERGNRVFPVSDKSSDVIRALNRYCENVQILFRKRIVSMQFDGKSFEVVAEDGARSRFDRVIVATGGITYPSTGSTGDGYGIVKAFGHAVETPLPALVGLTAKGGCAALAGLALKNIRFTVRDGDKEVFTEFGELLFTHQGISGPVVITASSCIRKMDVRKLSFTIDLKPALSNEQLDDRILRDFGAQKNRQFKNSLDELLPQKLIPVVVEMTGIFPEKPINAITAEERKILVETLKSFPVFVDGFCGASEAVITQGGVSVKEVNPKTMESKLVGGLYFCGELLDVDALTGGFNLQVAFSTGYVAGKSAAESSQTMEGI